MTDPLERAIEIFDEICDLAPQEQELRLGRIGAQDPALRKEVEEILLGDREPDGRLDRRADEFVTLQTVLLEARGAPVPEEVLESLRDRGRLLSHYRQEEEVGRGGMGAVHKVWDADLERRLAMKVLVSGEGQPSSVGRRRLQRFLDEARVTSQLDHPGIVPVHDLGIDSKGRAYFTMKLVKGRTLKEVFELVKQGVEDWTQTRVLHVILRVCEAMAYAHAKGVVHRDLKPTNVMVGRFGEVYVVDWGVARLRSRQDGRDLRPRRPAPQVMATGELELGTSVVTMDGTVVGTPNYMSPEQARGGWVDERSDVYAIGAMLYTLVTGRPPYGEESEDSTPYEVLDKVIEGPPPSQELSSAPPELEAICRKSMARAPEERYRDVSELADDLRAYLEGRVVSAHRTGAVAELRKWMERNRALALSIAAGIVILFAGLVVSLVLWDMASIERTAAQASAEEARKSAQAAEASEAQALRASERAQRLGGLATMDYVLEKGLVELWPAHPDRLAAYARWLDEASQIEALHAKVVPELAALRARAKSQSEQERTLDRRAHPEYPALQALEGELAAVREAQLVRDGQHEPMDFALDERVLPSDPRELNERAWRLVKPDRIVFGREAEGLALARRVVETELAEPLPSAYLDTLAWALFANGLDEEALTEIGFAIDDAPESEKAEFESSRDRLREEIEAARSGATLAALEGRHALLAATVSERRTWTFARPEDQQWHDLLARFVSRYEELLEPQAGKAMMLSPEFGWPIERRQDWARRVEGLTLAETEPAQRWAEAIASIADPTVCPAYHGLEIEPQLGLLPIGRDPRSGLWEFVDLQTGVEPIRGPDGVLEIDAETGLVFVLLPGEAFLMGAQSTDPGQPNHDASALWSEGPVHEVVLSPFFLSKYEMTQAQWLRMTGQNPSLYAPASLEGRLGTTLLHPVERVSWHDGMRVVGQWLGLTLPTEAQWEYAARGGTQSVWWSGDDALSLAGSANLADRSLRPHAPTLEIDARPELDDGYPVHAPVGGRLPNPFGLHDIYGNVWEWCLDTYGPRFYERGIGKDPVFDDPESGAGGTGTFVNRVMRGGSFRSLPELARSACRQNHAPQVATSDAGLRPARLLQPRR